MGGAVSAGENNDDLVDNLVKADYITSIEIEEIFRAVDRGNYYLNGYRDSAYQDSAWRHDHLHISAPCIYSKVMSALDLKPGLSFLNIGSGTGYLSTMVGLMLGIFGINHGIELHDEVVTYANEKVQEFILESPAFDKYTFCEPQFVIGNCLLISPDSPGYDRIYCGAACPTEYESFMKNLLNINGLLVMPVDDQLQVIKRTGQVRWETENILVVNFARLIVPSEDEKHKVAALPNRTPQALTALCRAQIRTVLSAKYHANISNRRHERRQSCQKSSSSDDEIHFRIRRAPSDRRPGDYSLRIDRRAHLDRGRDLAPVPDANSTRPDESGDASDTSSFDRRSATVNLLAGTVTTRRTARSEDEDRGRSNTDKPCTCERPPSRVSGASASSSQKWEDDEQPSTSKKTTNKKKKSRKNKNPGGAEVNGKAKRAKRGWALIRDRIRNRFTEKSIFSPDKTKRNSRSSVAANPTNVTQDFTNDETSEASRNRRGSDVSNSTFTTVDSQPSPPVTVRSLLLSMTDRQGRSLEFEQRIHENLANFFNTRRQMRSKGARPPRFEKSDSEESVRESTTMEEIPLPPNRFHDAILELPLPPTVKRFLLFYRTPN